MYSADASWFVYLLALSDCSAFKVGFSCNPLQRLYSFSHRYFERFDVYQSTLLRLTAQEDARDVEASLKRHLAEFRVDCPSWVPCAAGGHTEWFRAAYLGQAESRLRLSLEIDANAKSITVADFIAAELRQRAPAFETWARGQAQQVCSAASSIRREPLAIEAARVLRDWLDAYRYFDVPLFNDEAAASRFVGDAARLVSSR